MSPGGGQVLYLCLDLLQYLLDGVPLRVPLDAVLQQLSLSCKIKDQ